MSTSKGNIFLNMETLAFSMPLMLVCGTYAFFKVVPVKYGLPALAGLGFVAFIFSKIKASRDHKLTNMDDKKMEDLARELSEAQEESKGSEDNKKLKKKMAALQQRLAAERKKEAKNEKKKKGKSGSGANDDDDDYTTFAKGSRVTKKKN